MAFSLVLAGVPSNIGCPIIYPLKIRSRYTVVHHLSTGASGITRVDRAKYLEASATEAKIAR